MSNEKRYRIPDGPELENLGMGPIFRTHRLLRAWDRFQCTRCRSMNLVCKGAFDNHISLRTGICGYHIDKKIILLFQQLFCRLLHLVPPFVFSTSICFVLICVLTVWVCKVRFENASPCCEHAFIGKLAKDIDL